MILIQHRIKLSLCCFTFACLIFSLSCSNATRETEGWRARNEEVVRKNNLKGRERTVPHTQVTLKLEPGKVYELKELPKINIAEGVSAIVSWGEGARLEVLEMKGSSVYPEQALNEELITVVQDGSATCVLGEKTLELTKDAVLYLSQGMKLSLRA